MLNKIKKFLIFHLPFLIKTNIARYFPWSYRYMDFKLFSAALNITDNCCFKCITCNQWKNYKKDEIGTEDWKNILLQLKEKGVRNISLAGGEPFMRDDIFEIISFASSLGFRIGVITNGYLLNRDKIVRAIKSGVERFSVSIDGVDESFDNIRGVKGAYNRVLNNCRILTEYKHKNIIDVNIYFTLMKKTLNTYRAVFKIVDEFQFPLVVNLLDYTPYFFRKFINDKKELWIDTSDEVKLREFQDFLLDKKESRRRFTYHTYFEIGYFKSYFNDSLQKYIPCSVSQQRICIDARGNVYGGCWSMGSFGNLNEKSLKEIMDSAKYKVAHKNMFYKRCQGCSCGYPTNLRYFLPVILAGLYMRFMSKSKRRKKIYG